jgi:hypothetical protein
MTQKHTQGPWKVQEIENFRTGEVIYYVRDESFDTICDMYFERNQIFFKHQNAKANACLISAAPELLEIAEALIDWDFRNNRKAFIQMALEALKKAKGE